MPYKFKFKKLSDKLSPCNSFDKMIFQMPHMRNADAITASISDIRLNPKQIIVKGWQKNYAPHSVKKTLRKTGLSLSLTNLGIDSLMALMGLEPGFFKNFNAEIISDLWNDFASRQDDFINIIFSNNERNQGASIFLFVRKKALFPELNRITEYLRVNNKIRFWKAYANDVNVIAYFLPRKTIKKYKSMIGIALCYNPVMDSVVKATPFVSNGLHTFLAPPELDIKIEDASSKSIVKNIVNLSYSNFRYLPELEKRIKLFLKKKDDKEFIIKLRDALPSRLKILIELDKITNKEIMSELTNIITDFKMTYEEAIKIERYIGRQVWKRSTLKDSSPSKEKSHIPSKVTSI